MTVKSHYWIVPHGCPTLLDYTIYGMLSIYGPVDGNLDSLAYIGTSISNVLFGDV